MKPSVVVVAFGAPVLLEAAIAGLHDFSIVVVDNSSQDAVRRVSESCGARYVDPGCNLGFAAGVNRGLRELSSWIGRTDVLLLNPDAVVSPAHVLGLQGALHRFPRTAAVAPCLMGDAGPQRSAWPWPTPARMWLEALGGGLLLRRRTDFLVGAVLLLNAVALEDIGPFDERFFLYAEEADWQRRAVLAGWSVRLVDEVTALHVGAGTSDDEDRRRALFSAGGETYIRKWFGAVGWASYRCAALVGALLRSPLPGVRGAEARRRAVIYLRGPRRAAGLNA